jgi:hypothetical protein
MYQEQLICASSHRRRLALHTGLTAGDALPCELCTPGRSAERQVFNTHVLSAPFCQLAPAIAVFCSREQLNDYLPVRMYAAAAAAATWQSGLILLIASPGIMMASK